MLNVRIAYNGRTFIPSFTLVEQMLVSKKGKSHTRTNTRTPTTTHTHNTHARTNKTKQTLRRDDTILL